MIAWSRNASVLSVTKIRGSRTPVVFVLQSRLKLVAKTSRDCIVVEMCDTNKSDWRCQNTHDTRTRFFFSTKRETYELLRGQSEVFVLGNLQGL